MVTKFLSGVIFFKSLKMEKQWWLYNTVNVLNATEWYT